MPLVLDTNIVRVLGARDLSHKPLTRAANAGISLHLSETAAAELIHQLVAGQLRWEHWTEARAILTDLLDHTEPVLLGARPGLVRAGLVPRSEALRSISPDSVDASDAGWRLLIGAQSRQALTSTAVQSSDPRYGYELDDSQVRAVMAAEKQDWISDVMGFEDEMLKADAGLPAKLSEPDGLREVLASFSRIVADDIDKECPGLKPPASFRLDAFLRVHALLRIRRLLPKNRYNPVKDANDALDQFLLQYLGFPAAVCTLDSGIFSDVKATGSWQLKWIVRPGDLNKDDVLEDLRTMSWPQKAA